MGTFYYRGPSAPYIGVRNTQSCGMASCPLPLGLGDDLLGRPACAQEGEAEELAVSGGEGVPRACSRRFGVPRGVPIIHAQKKRMGMIYYVRV